MNPRYRRHFASAGVPILEAHEVADAVDAGIRAGVLDPLIAILQGYELQGGEVKMPPEFDAWLESGGLARTGEALSPTAAPATLEQAAASLLASASTPRLPLVCDYLVAVAVIDGVLDSYTAAQRRYVEQGGTVPMPAGFDAWVGQFVLDVLRDARPYNPDLLVHARELVAERGSARPTRPPAESLVADVRRLRGWLDALEATFAPDTHLRLEACLEGCAVLFAEVDALISRARRWLALTSVPETRH